MGTLPNRRRRRRRGPRGLAGEAAAPALRGRRKLRRGWRMRRTGACRAPAAAAAAAAGAGAGARAAVALPRSTVVEGRALV